MDYITRNGWTPCLEFSEAENAYIKDNFTGAQTSARALSCFGMRVWLLAASGALEHN